jgi:hypothetical protein
MTPSFFQNVYHEACFSVSETGRSQRGPSPKNMGDGEEFQRRSQLQQLSQLVMCKLAHWCAGVEGLESVSPFFNARFLDIDVPNRLHSTYRLLYNLAEDSQLWLPPDYPKTIEAIIFLADVILLNFFRGDELGCFHCMPYFLDSGSQWWTHVSSWVPIR